MKTQELRQMLCEFALRYAKERNLSVISQKSAVLFCKPEDNFHPDSFRRITENPDWLQRTQKTHQNIEGKKELQSSNSSDALLMNIFCYPHISKWKGVLDLLGVSKIDPVFGLKPLVAKKNGKGDASEIDMVIDDVFVEAKLTEKDFTRKDVSVVEQYVGMAEHFHRNCLVLIGKCFDNYQIIRNLLAAIQHNKRHILLCDERRPDLVRRYMETVCCLRDVGVRSKCRVVFWQEIQRLSGVSLGKFLKDKYGIC